MEFVPVARISSSFPTKFGIPRQSNLVKGLHSQIIFEPAFRSADAIRGLEGFSHLWLIWAFSASKASRALTVRPPRLGGNVRLGVFATRSPFRPNPIGLSCVRIVKIEPDTPNGPVITVDAADLMDGTPILDIKPYLPQADCIPDASGGFTDDVTFRRLRVEIPDALRQAFEPAFLNVLSDVLAQDPRPQYQHDETRVYGFRFKDKEIRFTADDQTIYVKEIREAETNDR